jgi:hypothetical protein
MAKDSKRTASNKRLQALVRAQKMNELLKIGGVQSQALLDSAGESRPSDESHVVELLDAERFTKSEIGNSKSRAKRSKARARPKPSKKSSAKKKKRR